MTGPEPSPPPTDPPAPARDDASRPAGRCPRAWVVLGVLVALLTTIDLATKVIAFRYVADVPVTIDRADAIRVMARDPGALQELVPDHEPVVVVPRLLEFKLVLNPGAVFGAGPGRRWFFIGFTIVVLPVAVLMFARWTSASDRLFHAALALILAGGIGNLYDRIAFACVRDFIHPLPNVHLPFGWVWPMRGGSEIWPYVSNVADAFLLLGIGIALLRLWAQDRAERREKRPRRG